MKSAFGVEHVGKAFDNHPKLLGQHIALIEHDRRTGNQHVSSPNRIQVDGKGKTLILRRPKYLVTAYPSTPGKAKATSDYYARVQRTPLHGEDRKKIKGFIASGKTKGKIDGVPTRLNKRDEMAVSAFGVEHSDIAKRDNTQHKVGAGRVIAGGMAPGFHAAVAGKPGHKLKAAAYELGGGVIGGPVGSAVGTYIADENGHYKPTRRQRKVSARIGKSAFGVDHDETEVSKGKVWASGTPGSTRYALSGGPDRDILGSGSKGNRAKIYGNYAKESLKGQVKHGAAGAGIGAGVGALAGGKTGAKIGAIVGADLGSFSGAVSGNKKAAVKVRQKGYIKPVYSNN